MFGICSAGGRLSNLVILPLSFGKYGLKKGRGRFLIQIRHPPHDVTIIISIITSSVSELVPVKTQPKLNIQKTFMFCAVF